MDPKTVDAASRRFMQYLSTGEGAEAVFTDDVFLDFTPPLWRVQARGLADAHALRLRGHPGPGSVPRCTVHATASGFAMEAEEQWTDARGTWTCREAFFAELRGDRIARLSVYCTGDWDAARRATHREQVKLLED